MNESDRQDPHNHLDKNKNLSPENPDFFTQLQETEKKKGKDARGKGHGWTTLLELFLGDW